MDHQELVTALAGALNTPRRAQYAALRPLAKIKYPPRELALKPGPKNFLTVNLAKWGWEYKHRGPKPKVIAPIDPAAVKAVLSQTLPDGYRILAIKDKGTHITVEVKKEGWT